MDKTDELKIYEKIVEELWDSNKIPPDEMMTINSILRGEKKIDFNRRWNIERLTYTKKYYEKQIKDLEEDKE